jgi:hypothetical protein
MTRSNILAPSDFRHGVTLEQPFPDPSALNKAMSDANDEALLSRLVVALAPVPGIEAIARARGKRWSSTRNTSARVCAQKRRTGLEERWRD